MPTITLKCVKEKSKLRIKFVKFTDDDGKVSTNVYNPYYNCRFPKAIRQEGLYYEIPDTDLSLAGSFYRVKSGNIKIFRPEEYVAIDISNIKIYSVEECIICLSNLPNIVYAPCGHLCLCNECNTELSKKHDHKCPLCRRKIESIIPK